MGARTYRTVLIGAGNVASFLKANIKSPFELTCVGGRNRTCSVPQDADLYIIAVSDRAISSVAQELMNVEGLVVHTAGSVPMDVLSHERRGVLYPLQTISKKRQIPASRVPFYVEASQPQDLELLQLLAESMGSKAQQMDSERRKYLHLAAVFCCNFVNRLYGITFKESNDIPVYHPDVKAYEVFDRDGSFLAVFYADFHPRKGKQGGAWMTEYQGQFIDKKGENVRPHVSVVMNLTKPTADKPALLTLNEVETFLHEFGHSLHGMFANTRFESLSGTNVWWDFVELPSQFMENYSVEKDFLRTFAFHYQTGEPLPDELISRIVKSRNFMAATACLRQVSFGLLDMAYYTKKDEFTDDIIPFEKKAWKKAILGKQLPDTCMTVQFSHIMAGGYAAGYYSYKWAEVLDADAFSVFKRNGIFDQKTAQRFRDEVLSKGGTEHPMELYRRFRGGEPTIDALLKRNGIRKAKKV